MYRRTLEWEPASADLLGRTFHDEPLSMGERSEALDAYLGETLSDKSRCCQVKKLKKVIRETVLNRFTLMGMYLVPCMVPDGHEKLPL